MSNREQWKLTLECLPKEAWAGEEIPDQVRMRKLLKDLLRIYKIKCVKIENPDPEPSQVDEMIVK